MGVINFLVKKGYYVANIYTFIVAMKLKQIIRKCFAVLLIVIFSLKAGAGLYLHNYIHVKNNPCASASGSGEIKMMCSCITDFYLPFAQTVQQQITLPIFHYKEHILFDTSSVISSTSFSYLLRAPPPSVC